ncbi:MAG: putative lipid II flippase FtsW [Pseudomonadota bacterium]|nr:putative lipid II flippase FtsW [Pseudomonadota bacterium]
MLSENIKKALLISESRGIDNIFVICISILSLIGLIMVASSTLDYSMQTYKNAFHLTIRHSIYLALGLSVTFLLARVKLSFYDDYSKIILLFAFIISLLVFIPGLGKTIKGATRWIDLGIFTVQAAEVSRLFILIWVSSYIVRKDTEKSFNKPLIFVIILSTIILLQNDFGSAVVLVSSFLALSFISGIDLKKFMIWLSVFLFSALSIAFLTPYRLKRLLSFMNPWEDPTGAGFQLIASELAFSKGGFFGLGLGSSVQKLFYLPESYNDFIFAIIAEELGLFFIFFVIIIFVLLLSRIFILAKQSANNEMMFASYLSYSIGFLILIQTLIHMSVNVGIMPTKGMGLPFISFGGTNILVMFICVGILIRIQIENRKKISQAVQRSY